MVLGIIHTHSTNTAGQVMHQNLKNLRDVIKQLNLSMSNGIKHNRDASVQSKNNVKEPVKTQNASKSTTSLK